MSVYRIWRSPTPFGQNVSGAQLIGEVAAGEEKFDYTIQRVFLLSHIMLSAWLIGLVIMTDFFLQVLLLR